jgi:hypothetical protein
MKMRSGQ